MAKKRREALLMTKHKPSKGDQKEKRDRIREIQARVARSPEKPSAQIIRDMLHLVDMYRELDLDPIGEDSKTKTHELFKYVPVIVVAQVERYFRSTVEYLIDNEPECRARAAALDVSFGIEEVLAIGGKVVTVGQFIAHTIRISSMDDIKGVMTKLLGNDFYFILKNASDYNQEQETFAIHHGDVSHAVMQEIFDTRHVICHEVSTTLTVTGSQCFDWLIEGVTLIGNTDTILLSFLIGGEVQDRIFGRKRNALLNPSSE